MFLRAFIPALHLCLYSLIVVIFVVHLFCLFRVSFLCTFVCCICVLVLALKLALVLLRLHISKYLLKNNNIIIIIIIIIIISFMQGIYTYIPEKKPVHREYRVSAVLSISLVPALALLYFYVSTFRSMCAVPNMAVFCISFTSWFPGMLLRYFLNDFEMVPVAPIITGITHVFTFHMRCISIVTSLYFKIFSASFLL